MNLRIKEFAALAGVSVRTLHYYHEIGLLTPARIERQTGYRFYDEESLLRMQQILFYRELDFPLARIQQLLSSPEYDQHKALAEQRQLLTLKKERLEWLISAIDRAEKGNAVMKTYDHSQIEAYKNEAKARWGKTDAYKEYAGRTNAYSKDQWQNAQAGMDTIFAEFAACMKVGEGADSQTAQALVKKLQQHISAHYYTCTPEILAGLGQMYTADERFRNNIDKHGSGTAEFAGKAIGYYCRKG